MPDDKLAFSSAVDARKLEIQLFWQRSLFFWGFIAAAFIAFAEVRDQSPRLAVAVSGFGLVCSVIWTLANRGSKYWQEAWESKVERIEDAVTGQLFSKIETPQKKGWWLTSRRFSVTRLTIALSDFTAALWLALMAGQLAITVDPAKLKNLEARDLATTAFAGFAILFSIIAAISGRSSVPRQP